jgi:hypothetical protein
MKRLSIILLALVVFGVLASACSSIRERVETQRYVDEMVINAPDCESGYALLYSAGNPSCMSIDDVQRLKKEGYL